jgi:hypothetical protein
MKEFQVLMCAKRSTRVGNGQSSLFEGHADLKQGDAYEDYSPHCSRAASCNFRPSCGKAEAVLPEESYSRQLRRSLVGGATERSERQCEELRPDAAGRPYSSKRESHRRSKVGGVTPPDSPNAKQKADNEKCQKYRGHSSIAISQKVAEYKKASKSADAAGEYAKGNIPVLQKHLETAKSLASKDLEQIGSVSSPTTRFDPGLGGHASMHQLRMAIDAEKQAKNRKGQSP